MSRGTACPPRPITDMVCGGVLYTGVNNKKLYTGVYRKKVLRQNSG